MRSRGLLLAAWLGLVGPAAAQEAELLARGELLFAIGGCTNCHTARGGAVGAGGDPLVTPFGTFHPPNITPDPATGIGGWSEADFIRAMRHGRAPDGSPYYPAFPYTSYALMPDEDLRALKAYLDSLEPVRAESPPHELRFPYNQRWGLRLWQWAFHEPRTFVPDPQRDAAWNRGAYLVEGPGHCQECHTPRAVHGALKRDQAFVGARLGPEEVAPNITSAPGRGIGDWTTRQLEVLLQIGMTPEGDFVGGDMGKVVSNGTAKLPAEDRTAIAVYLQTLPPR
jgi:mono/diheme cytochrome c family protein